jgi:hypothetical protein
MPIRDEIKPKRFASMNRALTYVVINRGQTGRSPFLGTTARAYLSG